MTLVWVGGAALFIGALFAYLFQAAKIARLTERNFQLESSLASERGIREKMQSEFKVIASEALENVNQQFLNSAIKDLRQVKTEADETLHLKNQEIAGSFKEIRSKIEEYQARVGRFEDERGALYVKMEGALKQVLDAGQAMRSETSGLKRVLASSTGVRGRWGERVLLEILEQNEFVRGINFDTQSTFEGGQEGDGRPDFVIKLPGNKRLIIDSKEVTGEYVLAQETEDLEKQKDHYARLVQNIRTQFIKLGRKEYQAMVDPDVPYVIMFIPSEAAIRAAFATDPSIFEEASAKKVILASPMTILPLIYLIKCGYQQEKMATNAKELGSAVERLGDCLYSFVGHLKNLQNGIQKCADSWNGVVGSWEKRVSPQIEKVKYLGGSLKDSEEISAIEPALREISDKSISNSDHFNLQR